MIPGEVITVAEGEDMDEKLPIRRKKIDALLEVYGSLVPVFGALK